MDIHAILTNILYMWLRQNPLTMPMIIRKANTQDSEPGRSGPQDNCLLCLHLISSLFEVAEESTASK